HEVVAGYHAGQAANPEADAARCLAIEDVAIGGDIGGRGPTEDQAPASTGNDVAAEGDPLAARQGDLLTGGDGGVLNDVSGDGGILDASQDHRSTGIAQQVV